MAKAVGLCSGLTVEHCCWVAGQVCRFLEVDTMPDRHWVCGLHRRLGSWEAVHNDPDYLEHVKPAWEGTSITDCGDWPAPGTTCGTCGVTR
jgi:hypothetical protein